MEIDVKHLESLLAEKKYDEVKSIIKAQIEAPLSEEEKGKGLMDLMAVYMDAVNAVNEQYRDALLDILDSLKELDNEESDMKDKIKLAEVRGKLG